jgi:hypothetical protein
MQSGISVEDDIVHLKRRVDIAGTFGWSIVSGITAMVLREKGEGGLNNVWRSLMTAEQSQRFVEALEKLGIKGDTPAVTAAKYHYFSNSIGGINMQYMEESPRKVWIRYLPPWGTYPGIAALAVPTSVRRTILSTWHPRNGDLLGCARLGWVATKFVAEGHPYDEGYFLEYDRDLKPEERFKVQHVEKTPEFDASRAPKLDPLAWPEARILKGSANYASDYVRHVIEVVVKQFGMNAACYLIESAMKLLAVQFTPVLKGMAGVEGNGAAALAQMYATIMGAFKNDPQWKRTGEGSADVTFDTFEPFPFQKTDEMRRAVFAFVDIGVRTLNGHIKLGREFDRDTGAERWTFVDTHKWLW